MSDAERLPVPLSVPAPDPFAAGSKGQFVEPWLVRVRDVDDDTMAGLLKTLVQLRRIRAGATVLAALAGALVFGVLDTPYALIIHATLAAFTALPVFSVGTLAIMRLFLKETQRSGLSKSAGVLILTRAQRRARLLAPWKGDDAAVELLFKAVRDPDTAD
ncbi:MAG: hypothetical protein HYS27_02870 [Deltaproteobacteria bacterium]|nr:hypothetical protein [Deltaproteobacteria bacterium]